MKQTKARVAGAAPLWVRLGVTLLAPLAVIGGRYLPLPGIDGSAVEELMARSERLPVEHTGAPPPMSLLGVGLGPVLSAYLLVELAAWLIAPWRSLRHGGLAGRSKLERATAVVALSMAAFQAYGIARHAESAGLVNPTGPMTTALLVVSLVTGVALLMLLARAIGRFGLCNGYAALAVSTWMGNDLVAFLQHTFVDHEPIAAAGVAAVLVGAAIVAGATLIAIGVRWDQRIFGRAPDAAPAGPAEAGLGYRQRPPAGAEDTTGLPLPASGVAPLQIVLALATLSAAFEPFGLVTREATDDFFERMQAAPVQVTLVAMAALVLVRLFNDPSRVAAVRARVADHRRGTASSEATARDDLRDAMVQTLAFVGVLVAAQLGVSAYGPYVLDVCAVALATALVADIASEWRARRRLGELVLVWPEHRPYAVDPVAAALAAADLTAFARGRHLRTLLQGFGPWVPIELLVRPDGAPEALAVATRVLHPQPPPQLPPGLQSEAATSPADPAPRAAKRRQRGDGRQPRTGQT